MMSLRTLVLALAALAACKFSALPPLGGGDGGTGDGRAEDGGVGDGSPDGPLATTHDLTSLKFRAADNPSLTADVTATITGTVVTASVPLGANQSLIATYTTNGNKVEVGGVVQQSGATANDFFGPVIYHVVAEDGSSQDYAVTVIGPVAQQAYIKASNTGSNWQFGRMVVLSSDGSTLAVGAAGEASAATGINGNQADTSAASAGAVYVLKRSGTTWTQQAYLKASNTDANDEFGSALALSADGNTLAVGAIQESSGAAGINGNQADNSVVDSGAVYVFTRSGTAWTQQAYIKQSNPGSSDVFGTSVALSSDGNTLAVGAPLEDSASTGINGNQADNTRSNVGAVYAFTRAGTTWTQQAYIKPSTTQLSELFGNAVALSGDGITLAGCAPFESSNATGINGNQASTSANRSGACFVFVRSSGIWSQQAYIKASNTDAQDNFGISVALSGDGNTLAVGSYNENSAATGIDGNQADNSAGQSGAAYVYTRASTTWSQQAYVKASNTIAGEQFGNTVGLSGDGNTLAVGAPGDSSAATGINGNQQDMSRLAAGAAFVLTRTGTTWTQEAYVKASNPDMSDFFGFVALSGDGTTLAVGAQYEQSNAVGVNHNQADNSLTAAGAVYVFH